LLSGGARLPAGGAAFPMRRGAVCGVHPQYFRVCLRQPDGPELKARALCGKPAQSLGGGPLWILRRTLLRKRDHLGCRCCFTLKRLADAVLRAGPAWASLGLGPPNRFREWGADLQQGSHRACPPASGGRRFYPGLRVFVWYWGCSFPGRGPGGPGVRRRRWGKGGLMFSTAEQSAFSALRSPCFPYLVGYCFTIFRKRGMALRIKPLQFMIKKLFLV